ncbi:MAG: DUF5666 domain-containing protein [bacterium]|nr:DUF5666 domain-containing protein [bacterium]
MGSKLFWSLLFGLVIVVLLAATLYVRSIAPGSRLPRPSPATTQAPSEATQPLTLTLTSPQEETVLTTPRVRVAGTTGKKAIVAIAGGTTSAIIDADEAGSFATEVQLENGVQTLTITAFHPDTGEEIELQINVIVESAEDAVTQSISLAQGEDAQAMEELRAKLATRTAQVADALPQRTRAFVGLIQSIDQGTLMVITKSGSKTVTLDPQTTIVEKGISGNRSSLNEGMRIAAIGEILDGKSLKAKKIIIPQSAIVTRSIIGDITDSNGKLTVRQLRKDEPVFLLVDANTSISLRGGAAATSSVLKTGSRVVAVGTPETPATIKTIRIVVVTTPARDQQPRSTNSAEAQSILAKAKAGLAQNRSASEDLFELVHFSAQTWNDTSLGVPQAGGTYAQVLTPGYKIIFQSHISRYEIHTDAMGTSMVIVDPFTRLE